MPDLESQLSRWQSAGILDPATAARIRAYESESRRPTGIQWQVIVALIFGGILLAAGVALFVNAHWDQIGPLGRYLLVLAMVSVFHLGGGLARDRFPALSTTLHAVGTLSTGAAIALVGQIFNIREHWPAAVLLWAIAALCGWVLLRDQAQQTIAVLLIPAWLVCEWSDPAISHQSEFVYLGRMLVTWSILYLTFFLNSRRRLVRGITFAVSAISLIVGTTFLMEGWRPWESLPLPWNLRIWGWVIIAVAPLLISLFRLTESLIPVALTLAIAIILPFCQTQVTYPGGLGNGQPYTHSAPNLIAHLLVTAMAVFLGWWGLRQNSKSLVNYGIVLFAISVAWFYFTDLFDKLGRSLGLIGLGILFLAGGWVLERTRRRLIAQIAASAQEAQ